MLLKVKFWSSSFVVQLLFYSVSGLNSMNQCPQTLPVTWNGKGQPGITGMLAGNRLLWHTILVSEVFIYSSYGIFINLSRIDGHLEYESSSVVLNIELLKLIIALVIAWTEVTNLVTSTLKWRHILPFAVPCVCYCFNNNLSIFMQDQMDPATFQVMCNLKIASTAVLYRIIMKRRLRNIQVASLGLLILAGSLNSYNGLSVTALSLQQIHITLPGLIMAVVYCLVSGFAGVYTEYILKRDMAISLPIQNCFLYTFGVLLNLLLWLFQGDVKQGLFHGYTKYTWAVIVCQALNGLIMSLILKHSTNIVRLFVITSAIPVATFLSVFIFGLQPGLEFLVVVSLVMSAIYLYNYKSKS